MKRYFVLMQTEKWGFKVKTNSFSRAVKLANLKFWNYAKIHDCKADDIDPPRSKCIYITDRRS